MKHMVNILVLVLGISFAIGSFGTAMAGSSYPEKPIKAIIPFGAGGFVDSTARILQKSLEKILPQPVVILNIPGGGAVIGSRQGKDANPNGYTYLMQIAAMMTAQTLGVSDFGPEDFEPVAQTGRAPCMICVRSDSRFKTLQDFVQEVKKNPNTVREAINIGAIVHFISLSFCDAAGGLKMRYVQTGGGAKRLAAILGGHADVAILGTAEAKATYDSGDIRILGYLGSERNRFYPKVATAGEQGYPGSFLAMNLWWFAPKGTPKAKIEVMADALEKAMKDPEVLKSLEARTTDAIFYRGEDVMKSIKADKDAIDRLAKKYNISKPKKK